LSTGGYWKCFVNGTKQEAEGQHLRGRCSELGTKRDTRTSCKLKKKQPYGTWTEAFGYGKNGTLSSGQYDGGPGLKKTQSGQGCLNYPNRCRVVEPETKKKFIRGQ